MTDFPDIVVAGHICFDVIPFFRSEPGLDYQTLLKPGKLINVGPVQISTGGPVSNTGLALHRLGVKVSLMGKVGNDFFGKAIIEYLSRYGVAGGMAIVPDAESSYTVIINPPGIDRMFLHNPGANNTFGFENINMDVVKSAKLFHLGYPPLMEKLFFNNGSELVKIFSEIKKTDTVTSLDMALPDPTSAAGKVDWAKILKRTLTYVDIFVPSAEEILYMLDRDKFQELSTKAAGRDMIDVIEPDTIAKLGDELIKLGACVIIIKCGYKGIYLRTATKERLLKIGRNAFPNPIDNWQNREMWSPSFIADDIFGTTGSGDCAIAGFLTGFINKLPPDTALNTACAVAWQNLRAMDSNSGVDTWEFTMDWLKKNQPKNKINIPNWTFCEESQILFSPRDEKQS